MEISTNKQTETVTVTQEKLSLKEKVSYGFGDFGNGFMFDLGQLYLLKFFTDVAGIPAAAAGGIFLVSKLFALLSIRLWEHRSTTGRISGRKANSGRICYTEALCSRF